MYFSMPLQMVICVLSSIIQTEIITVEVFEKQKWTCVWKTQLNRWKIILTSFNDYEEHLYRWKTYEQNFVGHLKTKILLTHNSKATWWTTMYKCPPQNAIYIHLHCLKKCSNRNDAETVQVASKGKVNSICSNFILAE